MESRVGKCSENLTMTMYSPYNCILRAPFMQGRHTLCRKSLICESSTTFSGDGLVYRYVWVTQITVIVQIMYWMDLYMYCIAYYSFWLVATLTGQLNIYFWFMCMIHLNHYDHSMVWADFYYIPYKGLFQWEKTHPTWFAGLFKTIRNPAHS